MGLLQLTTTKYWRKIAASKLGSYYFVVPKYRFHYIYCFPILFSFLIIDTFVFFSYNMY